MTWKREPIYEGNDKFFVPQTEDGELLIDMIPSYHSIIKDEEFHMIKGTKIGYNTSSKYSTALRHMFISSFGYVRYNKEFIIDLSKYLKDKKVLEVMAGTGFLSACLREQDIDIIATDSMYARDKIMMAENWEMWNDHYIPIEKLDAVRACIKYNDADVVIMSWPPSNQTATHVAMMCNINKIPLIYFGEDRDGCCADDSFFDFIYKYGIKSKELNDHFTTWPEYHDTCWLITWKGRCSKDDIQRLREINNQGGE